MSKQSSVDYFFEEVVKWEMRPWLYASEGGLEGIYEKAKAMHNEEIVDAYCKAGLDIAHNDSIKESGLAQQYYNETFGGEQC